jgi:uncharacterized LabA/DUF88 family protein
MAHRIRVFVDYWNFQLTINKREAFERGMPDYRFEVDWLGLGPWLVRKACERIQITDYSFDGINIYTSYNPGTQEGKRFNQWTKNILSKGTGVRVECIERKPKNFPQCPVCHQEIRNCPHTGCGATMISTVEKGVDTLIATDMIRLAWEDAYDFAVLSTMDRDLVPAVKFLKQKGRKVIHAGFPPLGTDLASACWASFDVYRDRKEIKRPPKKK